MYSTRLKTIGFLTFLMFLSLFIGQAKAFDIDTSDAATPDESAVNQTIAVFLSSPQSSTVTVNFATADGTATANVDYTPQSGTLTFAPNVTVQSISIPILADVMDEDTETIFINLSSPSSGTLVDNQAVLYLVDDDNPPTISITDNSTSNENAGATNLIVTLSASSSKTVTVDYNSIDATASSGADYTAVSGTITFNPGDNSTNIPISVLADTLDEDDEQLFVNLSNAMNSSIADSQGVLTIVDDDLAPSISISNATSADENSVDMVVALSSASGRSVQVDLTASDGSALQGSDFNAYSSTLTFAAGESSKTVSIPLINDVMDEDNETFTVTLSSPINGTISSAAATATITDDDAPPSVSIQSVSGAENSGSLSSNVTLSGASGKTVTVDYASADNTSTAGSDYTALGSTTLTFAPGQTSKTITASLTDDAVDEINETFNIQLSNPTNASIGSGVGVFEIVDNDPAPTISIADASSADETATATNLVVSLSSASEKTINVDFASSDGTATASSDYTPTSGTLTFAPGVTSQNIPVSILADSFDETNETVTVTLTNPSNVTLSDAIGELTITDDDAAPSISISDITTPDETGVARLVTVSLASTSEQSISVDYSTSNGTATATNDYVADNGTVTFTPGQSSLTIPITIVQDNVDEPNETFTVGLTNPVNASISVSTATITITDDEPTPEMTVAGTSITEAGANLNIAISLSGASSQSITANFATSDGSAAAGADYTNTSGVVTFNPGITSQSISIPILADSVDEFDETFTVTLSSPTNAAVSSPNGTMLILDNDAPPTISIADASSLDETAASTNLVATLSAASEKPITVDYATSDGTATAGSDYTSGSGTITFAPGSTSENVPVAVLADTTDEANETVTVTLSNPTNVTLNDAIGELTITDDDSAPSISIADVTIPDETAVARTATVSLSAASAKTVAVDFATADGTATATNDYSSASGTLTFNPGVTSQTVSVTIIQDSIDEPDETFTIGLSNPVNASISVATGVMTITDDESAPVLSISDNTTIDETASNLTATVTLSGTSTNSVVVNFATSDGTATAGNDYATVNGTLTFSPGDSVKTINVPILADSVDEFDETFTLSLLSPTNAVISSTSGIATMTITDDDSLPTVSLGDFVTSNEAVGTPNLVATLSAASEKPITVDYATSDGTATAGSDYTSGSGTITFAPGSTSENVPVAVLADTTDEANETVTVTLSNPTNVTLNDAIGELTITDDDSAPSISIADVTIPDETAVARTATVSLSAASAKTVTVDFATADGTAIAINDYVSTSGTLTFNPGVTSQTVSVTIIQDSIDEPDETFTIGLSNPVNASISVATGTMTITDDEGLVNLSIADETTADETASNLTATVTLSGTSSQVVTVNYATSDGAATAGSDYTSTSGSLTFNPGDLTQTFTIPILSDSVDENNETFIVTLSSPSNAGLSSSTATMTITDDDAAPTVSLGDLTSAEVAGTVNLVATLSAASEKSITVDYATSNGTATAGSDYTSGSGTITFAPGSTSENVPVSVLADTTDEANETVTVTLSNPTNVTLNDAIGELTITDDDSAPSISIADVTIPDETAVARTATVSLSAASAKTVAVDFATADGTATATNDYSSASGTLTFNPGVTSQTVSVTIIQDSIDEPDETFTIGLSNPVNASISVATGTMTITDDEGLVNLSIADETTADETASNLTATVTLSGTSSQVVTVNYATSDGAATAGSDYTSTSGSLTFNPGDLTQTFTIPILSDSVDENNETFIVTLSSPSNAGLSSSTATMTITDDDAAPTVSLGDLTSAEVAGTVNLVATLSAASEKSITVDYATSDGTATAGSDYTSGSGTITFAPGSTSENVPVSVIADTTDEANETVTVTLSNPTNVTLNDAIGELTITDDDSAPSISIDDYVTTNEAALTHQVAVRLSSVSGNIVTVNYSTADGTATFNSDYNTASGTLTFAAGETVKTINVSILADVLNEGNEDFVINLSAPSNATIADNQGIVTITDDDGAPAASVSDAVTLDESASAVTTTVSLSGAAATTVTMNWATSDVTATAGNDYTTAGGMLIFNPGETTKTISVNILSDNLPEGIETFQIDLSNISSNATINDGNAIITITDDDGNPTVSVESITVSESASNATVEFQLSFLSPLNVSVDYSTADGSASAGTDYTARNGTLLIAAGQISNSITIPILNNTVFDENKTFIVNLSNPTNASLSSTSAQVTIANDDEMLSSTETEDLSSAILFGKNSALRAETSFFGSILSRNTTLLSSNSRANRGPVLSFRNVDVDWSDRSQKVNGSFSFDNLNEERTRNSSWEASVSHTKNDKGVTNTFISTAFNFSTKPTESSMYGLILGGGYSETAMTGSSVGNNIGRSISAGIYAAYEFGDGLIMDLMASKTYEFNSLDTKVGITQVTGDYDRNSTAYSIGLQGTMRFAQSALTPKFKYTIGKSVFSTGTFDVKQPGLSTTQQIDFGTDEYFRLSFTPEFSTVLGDPNNLVRPSGFNLLTIRPKYFCEKYDYDTVRKCGQGLGLNFSNHHQIYNYDQDLTLEYDTIDDAETFSILYKRTY